MDQLFIDGTPLLPRSTGYLVQISTDMAMDYGLIPDTRPPLPPLPRRVRLRNSIRRWWVAHRPHMHFGPCPEYDYDD